MFYGELVSRLAIEYCMLRYHSTLQCPSHSCRNPQESTGIHRNPQESSGMAPESSGMTPESAGILRNPQESSGIRRNGTGIELKSSGMRLEHYVYMQIYVYKHLYVKICNKYNIFSFC